MHTPPGYSASRDFLGAPHGIRLLYRPRTG